jgi:hypothetical protein
MATTTNYGWTTPDDSALVKDGASAIRTLGSSVDTTVKALSPGTTAGDIDYYTSSTAKSRIGIGSSGQFLSVSGGVPAWVAAPSSSLNIAQVATATMSGTTVTISGLTQDYIQVVFAPVNWATSNGQLRIRLNGSSSAVYAQAAGSFNIQATPVTTTTFGTTNSEIRMQGNSNGAPNDTISVYVLTLTNCKAAGFTNFAWTAGFTGSSGFSNFVSGSGIFKTAAQITSIEATVSSGTAFQGASSYTVYGA